MALALGIAGVIEPEVVDGFGDGFGALLTLRPKHLQCHWIWPRCLSACFPSFHMFLMVAAMCSPNRPTPELSSPG